jgi:hypothetical protein
MCNQKFCLLYPSFAAALRTTIGSIWLMCCVYLFVAPAGLTAANAQFPLQPGEIVATCYSGSSPNGFVMGIIDVRNPGAQPLGTNWPAPMFHNEFPVTTNTWNRQNLGEVFGVCLDNANPPNIYVSATIAYNASGFGPAGPGGVYKINGTTGAIQPFASPVIPSGTASLGDVCFDSAHNQFFVSDLDTGLIYRLNSGGVQQPAPYDHGTNGRPNMSLPPIADSGTPGLTAAGRRVWGVQVFSGRLYYAVWNEDMFAPSMTLSNEIWSVGINPNGSFNLGPVGGGGPRREIFLPSIGNNYSSPVSDISFSANGAMLLAERSSYASGAQYFSGAHQSRVLEYKLSGTSWIPSGNNYSVGDYSQHNNSAGGIDYDCDGQVFATGDALILNGIAIYGVQIIPPGGNTPGTAISTSYLIDLDGDINDGGDKTRIGDVEVYRRNCDCLQFSKEELTCVTNGVYQYSFCFTNLFSSEISYLVFLDLPPGVTVTPGPIVPLPSQIQPGQGACMTVTIKDTSGHALSNLCYRVSIHNRNFDECCVVEHCVDIPKCCALLLKEKLSCSSDGSGSISYSFTLQNLTTLPIQYVFFVPQNNCFSITPLVNLGTPVPPGGTVPINLTINASANCGPQICFLVSIHDTNFTECCAFRHCVRLPDCGQAVRITNPANGAVLQAGANIVISADTIGNPDLEGVRFYAGPSVVGEATSPPYQVSVQLEPGFYSLIAEALFREGATSFSDPVVISVEGQTAPSPAVLQQSFEGSTVVLSMETVAGVTCSLEYSDSLTSQDWKVLETIVGTGRNVKVRDSVTNAPQRFYRIRMP